jgi:uncharacterized membrane protein YphA (DoxX/SURF4 family)
MLFSKAKLGIPAIIALVILRVVVGWHFFMEGTDKVKKGDFSSTGFLSSAKGPLADKFQSMIPDFDGLVRLNIDFEEPVDKLKKKDADKDSKKEGEKDGKKKLKTEIGGSQLEAQYQAFLANATDTYKLTEEQVSQANEILVDCCSQVAAVYKEWKGKIDEYKKGFVRVETLKQDPMRTGVASLRKQKDTIMYEWRGLVRPALNDIDKINDEFETRINALATPSQTEQGKKSVAFRLPSDSPIDVKVIDKIIPIFDMSVGILLIVGLLTPIAALAAGLFLASVVLTQFPGSYGSQPTYYQAIEMMACFFIAFADAGRFAGLDFFPWSFWHRKSIRNGAEVY